MALRAVDQPGMDERVVEDRELSNLLEKRLRAQDDKREIAGVYKAADQAAKEAIAKHELADGDAIRVGRFRITKVATEARHVEFDAAPGSRLTIGLWEERDQPAPAPRPRSGLTAVKDIDLDLRPRGEVNVDELHGAARNDVTEAERSTDGADDPDDDDLLPL